MVHPIDSFKLGLKGGKFLAHSAVEDSHNVLCGKANKQVQ